MRKHQITSSDMKELKIGLLWLSINSLNHKLLILVTGVNGKLLKKLTKAKTRLDTSLVFSIECDI